MSKLICDVPGNPCPDVGEAVLNVSSEVEDRMTFLSNGQGGMPFHRPDCGPYGDCNRGSDGHQDGGGMPSDPGGWFYDGENDDWIWVDDWWWWEYISNDNPFPPLGSFWLASSCGQWFVSFVSQEEADFWAWLYSFTCTFGPPDNPLWPDTETDGHPTGRQPYFNLMQTCSVNCSDGTQATYTVYAGKFAGSTQAQADNAAHSYACMKAKQNLFCLGAISADTCCVDVARDLLITASKSGAYTWAKTAGNFPTGMDIPTDVTAPLQNQLLISGTPTAVGTFTFTITATNQVGYSCSRSYTVKIIGIAPDTLPAGEVGTPYSEFLSGDGPVGSSLTWSIVSGSLPAGLSLNSTTGEISGTPI